MKALTLRLQLYSLLSLSLSFLSRLLSPILLCSHNIPIYLFDNQLAFQMIGDADIQANKIFENWLISSCAIAKLEIWMEHNSNQMRNAFKIPKINFQTTATSCSLSISF